MNAKYEYTTLSDEASVKTAQTWAMEQVKAHKANKRSSAIIKDVVITTEESWEMVWGIIHPILQKGGLSESAIAMRKSRLRRHFGLDKKKNRPCVKPDQATIVKAMNGLIKRGATLHDLQQAVGVLFPNV